MKASFLRANVIYIIEVIAILVAVSFLIAVSFCAFPCADDQFYSKFTNEAAQSGNIFEVFAAAIYTQIDFSSYWLALYSPATLQSLQPGIFGTEYYWLTCPCMMIFSFIGFAYLSFALSRYLLRVKGLLWLAIAGLLWLFFLLTMPSASQGLYWWNGAANYIPFWSGAALVVGLLVRYYSGVGRDIVTIILASILAFIVAGGNQTDSFSMILMLAYLCLISILFKKKYLAIIPFLISLIGFFIMATHPGTAQRADTLGVDISAFGAIKLSIYWVRESFLVWLDFRFVVFLALLIPFFLKLMTRVKTVNKYFTVKTCIIFFSLSVLYLFGIYCVPCYALGSGGPGRLLNVIYATFIVLLTINSFLIVGTIYKQYKSNGRQPNSVSVAQCAYVAVAIVLLFATNNNVTEAIAELRDGSLETYKQEMQERFETIEASDGGDVVVSELSVRPRLVYFDDIQSDPEDWRNVCYADYFSIDSIRTEERIDQ